jgi:hypothetical protein
LSSHRILVILATITILSILGVVSSRADVITLAWTAPGEDSLYGRASQYDLRYSTQLITADNFSQATTAPGMPAPTAPGTQQSYVLAGLTAGTVYYLALKTADGAGNWSAMSNVIARLPSAGVVPGAPALLSPADGVTGLSTGPTLLWLPASGATSYHLQVSTRSDFGSSLLDASPLTATSLQLSGLETGTVHYWRVQGIGAGGAGAWSAVRSFTTAKATPTTDVSELALSFAAPWPNPARQVTRFFWAIPAPASVSIQVFDLAGRRVRVLREGPQDAGRTSLDWDLHDSAGNQLAPGVYLVRAALGASTFIRRVVIAR